MEWIEARLYTTNSGLEIVSAMLYDAGIINVRIDDEQDMIHFLKTTEDQWDYVDESLFEESGKESSIIFYVSDNSFGHEMMLSVKDGIKRLRSACGDMDLGRLELELCSVNDEMWLNEWKKYYKPFKIGESIVVKPSWEPYEAAENETVIVMNPGHVFGTGLHQSTQLCVAALEKTVNADDTVLDLGCGSGILSIASILLGAAFCRAVDMDENAADIANENARLNGIGEQSFFVTCGNILKDKNVIVKKGNMLYNIVVANIVADVIISIAPLAADALADGGAFISSGIISERFEDVEEALLANSFLVESITRKDDWVCITARKKRGV